MSSDRIRVTYVTSSSFKAQEVPILKTDVILDDGRPVMDIFDFDLRQVQIKETLEVDLFTMVKAEVEDAYTKLRVPCVVEHAGLIFEEFKDDSYPGGLTKPMWNTLRDRFAEETHSTGRRATARAVVGYCDGQRIMTFSGETNGFLADRPRGSREFYWDTLFVPDLPDGTAGTDTYAEIVDDRDRGLKYKVVELSQSTKAMKAFLEYRRRNRPQLWLRG